MSMILSAAFALASILAFPQLAKKADSPPDRAGEPVLRQIMESTSKLRGVKLVINTGGRSGRDEIMQPGQTITMFLDGPNRFSICAMSGWGDGTRYVCDGQTLLIDRLDQGAEIILKKAPPTIWQAEDGLAAQGDPFIYLIAGPSAIEKMVAKDGFIRQLDPAGPERAVQFKSAKKGTVTVFYLENDPQMLVQRVEYDDLPNLEEQYKLYPEWMDKPDQPLTVQSFHYVTVGGRLPGDVFDTTPPKGMKINDQRPKH